ncbi:MAG: histidine ammonia-lyase [bacterium]|nr:histidine ammonia-lyase [bacterium]
MKTLTLDGRSLTLADLAPIARGEALRLRIAKDALTDVRRSRAMVDERVGAGAVVYGLTTGFGRLKNTAIAVADLEQLQRNLVLSHCVGVGEAMPLEEVRIAQVLRLNSLLRGASGVRVELVRKLARLFDKGFVPVVPQQGSVGASGDLAPLAHMAAAYMGHGHAYTGGKRRTARAALRAIEEEPLELLAKEGLALINGTEIMKATGVVCLLRAINLSKASDVVAALTLESLFGSLAPFDAALDALKPNAGQRRTAANVRACLAGSKVLPFHAECERVQDAYSLRCVPQIHGAFKTALAHVVDVFAAELNAVTDNPVVLPATDEVYSAGLFHGQPISMSVDYLGLAACTLANVSERRIEQLVNPDLSRVPPGAQALPAFLTPAPGLHSGLMIVQYAAAALASENKIHAHPASVDTIPASAGQEDHVSMGITAVRKARTILDNTEQVVGIELVCAGQAREFNKKLRAGRGAEAAYAALRERVRPLKNDRYLEPDLAAARELVASGDLVRAVERCAGALGS